MELSLRKSADTTAVLPASSGDERPWYFYAIIMGLLAVATLAAYCGVWNNGFVNFDDPKYVTDNLQVKYGLSYEGVKWAFGELGTDYWHPLMWLSHMLDVTLFGLHPAGHHLVSLLFHILNVLMLFGLLLYATGRKWPSALVAGLFALHPLHVESVAWVAERKDVLSTFFCLSAIWMYVSYARRSGWMKYVAVMVLYAMALMSKPMVVTFPIMLLLIDYWPMNRFEPTWPVVRKLLVEKLPFVLMSIAIAVVTVVGQQKVSAMAGMSQVDIGMRLGNAVVSYWRYIGATIWPGDLAVIYPYVDSGGFIAAVCLLLLVAVTVVALLMRQRRYLAFGWLWYLATLLPVIGIVQVGPQSHADRYTYIPLIGFFVAVAWLAADVAVASAGLRRAIAATAAALLILLGLVTMRQVGYWKDSVNLFARAVTITRDNHIAMTGLGHALIEAGKPGEAMSLLTRSLELKPDRAETLSDIGKIYYDTGRYDEAWKYYQKAVRLRPDLKDTQLNAATTLISLGRFADAEGHLKQALLLDSQWPEAWTQMGVVLGAQGRLDEAIAACRNAMAADPKLGAAHYTLAGLYTRKGQLRDAVAEYRVCAAMAPSYYPVWNNLGDCLVAANELSQAEEAYRKSIELEPSQMAARYGLAVALYRTGRKSEALVEARKAAEQAPGDARVGELLKHLTDTTR